VAAAGVQPALGNPTNDGDVLSSTVAGVRSWLARDNLSSSTPANLGTAAAGTADSVSRSDHVHAMPSAADVGAAAALWHGHSHRVTTAVTLPEIETGGSVSLESGAVLQLG